MKAPYVTKLPILTPENLETIMKERIEAVKTPITSIPVLWQGYLEQYFDIAGEKRTGKMYVPKDTRQGTNFVLMNVPEGEETIDFLEKSGWIECADKYQICIFAAEAGAEGWKSPEEEFPYLNECMDYLLRGEYFRAGLSVYVVGYGEIGAMLHKLVMNSPLVVAAAAFVNASGIERDYTIELEGRSLDTDDFKCGVDLKDVPVPVWIIEKEMSENARYTVSHWINAIGASAPEEDSVLGMIYHQNKETTCTPEGNIVQVGVAERKVAYTDRTLSENIAAFLKQYSRYTKMSPYGNSVVRFVDYDAQGVEVRYFTDSEGKSRECLIYVPKKFRGKGKLPMVLAIHGACETVRNFFEETQWYRIADQEGFIVVVPEAVLNEVPELICGGYTKAYRSIWNFLFPDKRKSELDYFKRMLDEVIADYPVDEERIYCTGHSMGCMTTQLLCSSPLAERFAAAAATCAPAGIKGTDAWDGSGTSKIPFYLEMAEYDLWSYKIDEEGDISETIDKWLVWHELAEEDNVKQVRLFGASEKYTEGRYNITVWKNDNGIPLLRYEWVKSKDHMNCMDDNVRFWNNWFSKWILDKEKGRRYLG